MQFYCLTKVGDFDRVAICNGGDMKTKTYLSICSLSDMPSFTVKVGSLYAREVFQSAIISGCLFDNVTFENVSFIDCEFVSTQFNNCNFINCTFSNCRSYYCEFMNLYTENSTLSSITTLASRFKNVA